MKISQMFEMSSVLNIFSINVNPYNSLLVFVSKSLHATGWWTNIEEVRRSCTVENPYGFTLRERNCGAVRKSGVRETYVRIVHDMYELVRCAIGVKVEV